jgi:hypothetical protein
MDGFSSSALDQLLERVTGPLHFRLKDISAIFSAAVYPWADLAWLQLSAKSKTFSEANGRNERGKAANPAGCTGYIPNRETQPRNI